MIVGNGLLANLLKDFLNEKDLILYTAGVSNSSETDLHNYARETTLLLKTLDGRKKNEQLIYFSTFSVFDPTLQSTFYVKHKLSVEKIL
ncbi:MAG: hypothetical protein IAF38_04285, partial [Bacteroidia bacterium]|nr:hypothetical protein [Bacteroidia bacterium]